MVDELVNVGNDEPTRGTSSSYDEERGNEHKIYRPEGYGIDNGEGVASQGGHGCEAQRR
jgi:hypothetical protein